MEAPLSLLCVDDDQEFCNYLKLLAQPYNLVLTVCGTVEEAKKLIDETEFKAFILDVSLGEDSGLELAKWIRETQGEKVPVAIVSGVQKDAATFRDEKERLAINYVFDKPLKPQDVRGLFEALCRPKSEVSSSLQSLSEDPGFQALKKEYDKTIYDKMDQLELLCRQLAAKVNLENMKALSQAAHKIAGSAATYGYPEVTAECRAMEQALVNEMHLLEQNPEAEVTLPYLESFLGGVKMSFQMAVKEESDPYLEPMQVSAERLFAYLVTADRQFVDAVDLNESKFGLNVLTETDPDKAIKKLSEPDFNPQLVIVDHFFRAREITGEQILDVVRGKEQGFLTSFGMLVDEENLNTRIEMMQKGIKHVFHIPIAPEIFLESLEKIFREGHVPGFKVLVIDDDPDICNYLAHILHEKGMEVKSLLSGNHLFETLKSYRPNCLLLDILLPKHSGVQILGALRSDPRYADMAIIIITSSRDEEVRRLAYESNVDDILYKPLDKKLVQTRIYNIAMRREQSSKLVDLDPLTGLPTQRALYFYLHKLLGLSERRGPPPLMVLISLDNYDDWHRLSTSSEAEKVVVSTAYTLVHNLPNTLFTAYLGHGRFAVVHESKDVDIFRETLSRLLAAEIGETARVDQKLAEMSYSCGIAPFPRRVKKVNVVIESAEEALKNAESSSDRTPPVTLFMQPFDREFQTEKTEVLLIDPDIYLLEILEASFEGQGLKTTRFTSGEKALEELLSRSPSELPSLIISERNLADMEGLEVLKILQRKLPMPPPFIFLTTFSSEKDVFEGLSAGAQDYIAKPFNLKILMKKAHALLF